MKLKVQVKEYSFNINIGEEGLNDFAWLALAAAKLYGKKKYPSGNYLPILLKYDDIIPHPRTKIIKFIELHGIEYFTPAEGEEVNSTYVFTVELYKQNAILTQDHQDWFSKAFGEQRNKMKLSFQYLIFTENTKKKDNNIQFQVHFSYQMFKELKGEHKASLYSDKQVINLVEQQQAEGTLKYRADVELPYGHLQPQEPQLFMVRKNDTEQKPQQIQSEDFTVSIEPQPISQEDILKKIKNRMTIPPQLSEKLLQQEQEIKKEVNTGSFCPFDFNTLWLIIENNSKSKELFDEIDMTIKTKMQKTISDNLNKLYEIFFEYSMLYVQNTDKKEEITISLQDIMHFIKFYQLLNDSLTLFQFLEVYDSDNIRIENAKTTIDNTIGIMFPEFIEIIVRCVNFHQADILMQNEESLDISLEKAVNKIVTIDSSEQDLNEFHKHMKYNITLMTFIRENSELLQAIFFEKLQDSSLDNKKFLLLQEQVKSLIIDAGFKGDNLDDIVSTCIQQLINEEKYGGYEGIFYYEFLQVMQWLSLVLITDQEDEDDNKDEEEDPEQGVEQLIEKFRFFLTQFQ